MLRTNIRRKLALMLIAFVIANMANLPGHFAGRAASAGLEEHPVSDQTLPETRAQAREAYGKLPISFELNHGQTAPQVKFLSRGNGYNLFLTSNEAVLAMSNEAVEGRSDVLKIRLVGANAEPQVTGADELPGKSNYFLGNDPQQWRTNVANYAKVKYDGVYPGIDMVYYGAGQQLEYDFIVAPGADPGRIELSIDGAQKLRLDEQGDLVMGVGRSEIRQRKPFVYQEVNGVRKEIATQYSLSGKRQFGFKVAEYDKSLPLVIDPVLVYSTLLGGGGSETARGIAVEGGFAYVTGVTTSVNFPTTAGSAQPVSGGRNEAFVAKLNRAGSALVYSTYLGGSLFESGAGIVVKNGVVTVTGNTTSVNFPTTAGAFQTVFGGSQDAFVTRLNSTGSALVYSTYIGGNDIDDGRGIALNHNGDAFVAGLTESLNFPITAGAFQTVFGDGVRDAFVTKLNSAGSALAYSTYIGGAQTDQGHSIAVDHYGNAYVTGITASGNFPTTAGAFQTVFGGGQDAFAAKLNQTGSALVYSTYLGGANTDIGLGVTLDVFGRAYVTGSTDSASFPTTAGAFQTTIGGSVDAFVTKVNSAGSALVYSTFLGGAGADVSQGIDVRNGRAFVTGNTDSANFPTTANALQPVIGGASDAFITKLNAAGSALHFSSYLGGNGDDSGQAVALGAGIFLAGVTSSVNFPTTAGAFQTVRAGGSDGFVSRIRLDD
jgi:Beta-propeller repeat